MENIIGTTTLLLCLIGGGIFVLLFMFLRAVRVIPEYERGVVFTLGKFTGIRNPGLTFLIPIAQKLQRVDMRLATAEVPRQEVMTKDNIISTWMATWDSGSTTLNTFDLSSPPPGAGNHALELSADMDTDQQLGGGSTYWET